MAQGPPRKWTDAQLIEAVPVSYSFWEVAKRLGITYSKTLRQRIFELELSIHHFDLHKRSRESIHRRRRKRHEIFTFTPERRVESIVLRRAFLEYGPKYECVLCGIPPLYNHKKLVLQIDHINGNRFDNRIHNLRWLCPNCHSQTDTFTSKNWKSRYGQLG